MNSIQKSNIVSLCRIKVNKMLSTLNSNNQNIFIPKYTLNKKSESNYISNLTTNNKPKKIIKKAKPLKSNIILKRKEENKPVDFIINRGVLVYQRNMKGEEVINYRINKIKTGNNFNKKNIKKNTSKKIINTSRTNNDIFWSNTLDNYYNKDKKENSSLNHNIINSNNINKIKKNNLAKKKSSDYIKIRIKKNISNKEIKINQEINNKITYLITKLKEIFDKKIKSIFFILKYFENNINNNNNEGIIISHKKSKSIIVNKALSSNLSNLISKNFKFFTKEKNEPELFRDSKSLEKKYEQICKRKKLNMSMTFSDKFRENNYLSERNTHDSFSNEVNDILIHRIDKYPSLAKKNTSYNFSFNDINIKEESFNNINNNNNLNKKISLYRNYFLKEKRESQTNIRIKKYLFILYV